MAEMHELVLKRGRPKAQLTRFKNYIDALLLEGDIISNEITGQVESRLNKMNTLWKAFDDIAEDPENQNIERDNFEREFLKLESKMKSLLLQQQLSSVTSGSDHKNSPINIKLPTIELPTFDGKLGQY